MRLVLKLHKDVTTTEGQKITRPNENIIGIQYVFDDYDKAVEYAGDPLLVKKISIVD